MTSGTALLIATAVHLGFQVTVTALVYPALARTSPDQWKSAHDRHSRAVAPLVAVVYGALALSGGWALLTGPGRWTLTALTAVAATWLTTGFAALSHQRLGAGHSPEEIQRLLRIDRIRMVTAAASLVAAALAATCP